ncbi:MAG: hypothetical protein SH818_06225 [Saprospiraceae bacterium]|nr:hypothetical protein [Saprospiraceae bacterium]
MQIIKTNSNEAEFYESIARDDRQMAQWILGFLTELDQDFEKLKDIPPEEPPYL